MPRQAMKFDDWKAKVATESPKTEKIPTLRLVKEPEAPKTMEAVEALASQEETTPEEEQAIEANGNLAEKVPEVGPKVRESKRQAKKELKEAKRKRKVKIKEVIEEEKREEAKEEKVQPEEVKPEEAEPQTEERPEGRISEIRELEPEKTETKEEASEVQKKGPRSELYLNLAVAEKATPRGWRYESSIRKIKGGLLFDQGGVGSIHVEPRLARTLRKAEKPVVAEPEIEEKAPESREREVTAGGHPAEETEQEKFQRQIKYLKSELDEKHPDPMAAKQIEILEKKLNALHKEVASQPKPEEKTLESGEKKTEAAEKKLSPEQIKTRILDLVEKAEGLILTPQEIALENPEAMLEGKKKQFTKMVEAIIDEPDEVGLSEEISRLEDALNRYHNLLVSLSNKNIGKRSSTGKMVMRPEKILPEDYAYRSKELVGVINELKGSPSVAEETLGKEDIIPEIKTSPMAETIKQPEAEAAKEETKTYAQMVTEAALAEPEAIPVKKAKTAKAKAPETLEKPPEPVKSKVETKRVPAKIVFEGKTEDLLKGAARSDAEQKKRRLEARLSEIKNSETNEWSDAYADLGGFDQALWEQLSPEKGNEAKSERERFKELRLNAVGYDLKEAEISNGLRIRRNRTAGYEHRLKDASLNKGDREDLEDELKDIRNSEKAALLELKGIEDLRKKDEAEEAELLGKAQERLAAKKAETEGVVDVDLSEINAAVTPEAQGQAAAEAGKGKKGFGSRVGGFAKKAVIIAPGVAGLVGLGYGTALILKPILGWWVAWRGVNKLLEGMMEFSKDPGAWFKKKSKDAADSDFWKTYDKWTGKKKTEKTSKE